MTGYPPLVDTDRDELRGLIGDASSRFDALVRSADPQARLPRSDWSVAEAVAHVLSVAHRYQKAATVGDFRRAQRPRDLDAINAEELGQVMAPVPEMADRILALKPVLDDFFDRTTDQPDAFPFHGGNRLSGVAAQTNWLGELLLHGADIAAAVGRPWDRPDRAMTLVCRGVMEIGTSYVRASTPADTDIAVHMRMPGARPYLLHVIGNGGEVRPVADGDRRPDAVLRGPGTVFADLLYQRIGPLTAARRGLLVVGGRRPWVALTVLKHFEAP